MKIATLSRGANNFDFIRLMAAVFVIVGHSNDLLNDYTLQHDPVRFIFGRSIQSFGVLVFFIISGYLVTASFENKKSWIGFFSARVLRIFPALIVVVLLSVFILGTLLTTLSLHEYFSSPWIKLYLQNMTLYRMYYHLPGVFEHNPITGSINASLWTLPYEFTCYLCVALSGIFSFTRNKWVALFIFISCLTGYIFFKIQIDKIIIPVLGIDFKNFFLPFLYFFSGALFYKFRTTINYNVYGLVACAILTGLVKWEYLPPLFLTLVIPYLVFFFAFSSNIKLSKAAKYGDFSYGMYLYAFPIQQLIIYVLPDKPELATMFFLSVVCTFPFAFLSWHLVEKPALNLKKKFS